MESQSLKTRTILALLGVFTALSLILPNVINLDGKWWFSHKKINYGLDIQGGLHLVMGVDIHGAIKESVQRTAASLKLELLKKSILFTKIEALESSQGELTIGWNSESEKNKIQSYMSDNYGTLFQEIESRDNFLKYRYLEAYLLDYKNRVIQQSIETIRNRIDEFGVAEPSITQQGTDRILVQLPGMADAEKAKALISQSAKLDFMVVDTSTSPQILQNMIAEVEKLQGYSMKTLKYSEYIQKLNQDLQGKIPEKTAVYFERTGSTQSGEMVPYLLKTDSGLGGADLDDASMTYDPYGKPGVSLRFNPQGSNKFAELTGANVHQRLAIVLDKIVKSAPVLNERIGGGSAFISFNSDNPDVLDEVKMVAMSLRAGSLPTALTQLEERRVGPSLGADSLAKAKFASYVGAFLILLFMVFYYRSMGVISSASLGLNILSVLAVLTSLGATLTLPGIAGIALTVGFAVDANVLINERIREELRKGVSLKLALKEGYSMAMSAILDSNITTAATAVVLLYFGTGPVKGFAVTLLVGIGTTLFANVFVSKVIVDNLVYRFRIGKISV